jgi:hypothetical protein
MGIIQKKKKGFKMLSKIMKRVNIASAILIVLVVFGVFAKNLFMGPTIPYDTNFADFLVYWSIRIIILWSLVLVLLNAIVYGVISVRNKLTKK